MDGSTLNRRETATSITLTCLGDVETTLTLSLNDGHVSLELDHECADVPLTELRRALTFLEGE